MRCLSIGHPVKHELFFHSHATLFLSLSIRLTKNATNIFEYPFNVIHIFTGNKLVNRIKKTNTEQIYVNQIKLQQKPTELF